MNKIELIAALNDRSTKQQSRRVEDAMIILHMFTSKSAVALNFVLAILAL